MRHLFSSLTRMLITSFLVFSGLFLLPSTEAREAWAQDTIPKLPLLEFKGYFRFRGDIMHNMAMGVGPREEINAPGATRPKTGRFPFPYPTLAYPLFNESLLKERYSNDYPKTLSSANMRFRLRTTFNISEQLKIHTTFDFLDNLVLGSSPRGNFGELRDPFVPLLAFSDTQLPPTGMNSLSDSVRVRHVFASIRTPIGVFRAGRMPSHWGLGILANKGMDVNSDYGDTVDRVMFITRLFGHYIIPAMDFVSSGPLDTAQRNLPLSQPFDPEPEDNARQFIIAIAKSTRGKELEDRKENGDWIVNYGFYFIYRNQDLTAECDPRSSCTNKELSPKVALNNNGRESAFIALKKRGARAYIPDVWFRLMWGETMRLEFEWVFIIGSVDQAPNQKATDVFQWGGALEFEYRLLNGRLWFNINLGIASGDRDFFSRWGFNPDTDAQKDKNGQCRHGANDDGTCRGFVGNFKFDPDYNIDMILWREMYGTITNAWYTKFALTYNIAGNPWEKEDGFAIRLAGIYSMALNENATLGKSLPLGIELNGSIRYASDDGYFFDFSYGILFPLPGLAYAVYKNPSEQTGRDEIFSPSIAQRFWFRVGIKF